MRPHTPARLFLVMLMAAVFAAMVGLGFGNPYLGFGAYLLALVGLLLLGLRRDRQVAPDDHR
jgi:membrane protein implicated in regulation of membrane protease activity